MWRRSPSLGMRLLKPIAQLKNRWAWLRLCLWRPLAIFRTSLTSKGMARGQPGQVPARCSRYQYMHLDWRSALSCSAAPSTLRRASSSRFGASCVGSQWRAKPCSISGIASPGRGESTSGAPSTSGVHASTCGTPAASCFATRTAKRKSWPTHSGSGHSPTLLCSLCAIAAGLPSDR